MEALTIFPKKKEKEKGQWLSRNQNNYYKSFFKKLLLAFNKPVSLISVQ